MTAPALDRSRRHRTVSRRTFLRAAALGAGAILVPQALRAHRSLAAAPGTMKYRRLGATGIEVSEIAFGSHLSQRNMDDPEARTAQIRKGLELGVNLFDIYEHTYHQFALMSRLLAPVRQEVVLSLVTVGPRLQTMQEVESALRTFDTDAIDLYRIYWSSDSPREEMEVRFQALQLARQQGKVRAVGLASHDHADLAAMLRAYPELDYLMLPYNFRHQKLAPSTAVQPASWGQIKAASPGPGAHKSVAQQADCMTDACPDPQLMPLVRERGTGLIAMKPFAAGGLLQLLGSDPLLARLEGIATSLPQAALRFVLETPEVACALPAMNAVDEVVENLGAVQGDGLSRSDVESLRRWAQVAEMARGSFLPDRYQWLERWRA